MIIISAGMQKSGSAYMYNIINDLLIKSGNGNARKIKDRYRLTSLMQWHNNNIGRLRCKELIKLILISFIEGMFVVKTHSGPTPFLRLLIRYGFVKVIYIYRDPRDVVLSVIDHGNKILAKGENHTFAQMATFDKASLAMHSWVDIWRSYSQMDNVLKVRYEDLIQNPEATINKISEYLNISVPLAVVKSILWKYNRANNSADMTGLHFNKAQTGRYKTELSISQMDTLKSELGTDITRMGYEL